MSTTSRHEGRRPDPRPERTRAILTEALMDLIQEKRWDRIRVQDVLDRTKIGRSTFYSHFNNKYDLLTAAIPDLTANIIGPGRGGAEVDLLPLFEHIGGIQPILRPALTQPLLGEIAQSFHAHLKQAWTAHLKAIGVPSSEHDLVADVLAGSLVAVVKQWVMSSQPMDPAKLCEHFSFYSNAIISAAVISAD